MIVEVKFFNVGEGYVIKDNEKCKSCKGQKVNQEKKALEIDLDKGAPDGKRYVFAGESDEVPGVEPGDVIVEIMIEKHKLFIRKGADLIYNASINLVEALTGLELIIDHLDGRKIHVKTKEGDVVKPGVLKTSPKLNDWLESYRSCIFSALKFKLEIFFPYPFTSPCLS